MTHATTKNQMSQDTCTDYITAVPMLQKPVHCIDFPIDEDMQSREASKKERKSN